MPKLFAPIVLWGIFIGLTGGCLPRVSVCPNPGPTTPGIRYYRPKPYLFISPAGETTTIEESRTKKKVTSTMSDQYVQMQLQWLPDFSEEYAINIRSGFGTNATELTLENGWNLTRLNTKLDSQTDENISAVADLLGSAAGILAKSDAISKAARVETKTVIRATNVPIGYYESVIGKDACGKKQFHGWRYVGFAPFNGCPLQMGGSECRPCQEIELYGLVFDNGAMTFKQLYRVEATEQKYLYPAQQVRPQSPLSAELHLLPLPATEMPAISPPGREAVAAEELIAPSP